MRQELVSKAKEMLEEGLNEVYFVYQDGTKEKRRLFLNSGDKEPCVFRPRSRRYGTKLAYHSEIADMLRIEKKQVDEQVKWYKDLVRMKSMLEESGLWKDLLEDVKVAMEIGLEPLKKAYSLYWRRVEGVDYHEQDKRNLEDIKALVPKIVRVSKEDGHEYVDTGIIWYLLNIKIKKMNFGSDSVNEYKLKEIADALREKRKIRVEGRTNYDVSFEYNPEIQKAWYSEEYKNCGNGHYYLALNGTHAIFWEDD